MRILFTSVFKPFGVDAADSRRDSKCELYHNQLTKYQGVFSIRTTMLSYGLHVIANNLEGPSTVLEFPTWERFCREAAAGYDLIGIGSILPNFEKLKRMTRHLRQTSPKTRIVIGGFCATIENLAQMLEVDDICVGEGISFMRKLLGQPKEFTFQNPLMFSELRELFGVPIFGAKAAHIPVGLGCPYGCDFCHPSHFFGRKHIKYFTSGRRLFEETARACDAFGTPTVNFVGDDNFLVDQARAHEFREAVLESGRQFQIFLFASADQIERFGVESLAELGAYKVWIGRESTVSTYRKNQGIDLPALIARLHAHGIKVVLSSILLLDEHTPENIEQDVQAHLDCRPEFSQFSFYSPAPGTPLYDRMKEEGRLLPGIPFEEMHAFKQPWYSHPHFNLRQAEAVQEKAYLRDYHEQGPSLLRWFETDLLGYLHLKDSPNPHLRRRAAFLAQPMPRYRLLLRAIERLAPTAFIRERAREVRSRIEAAFGRITLAEEALALGLVPFGRFREWRTARFGDAIQPRTYLYHYPGIKRS